MAKNRAGQRGTDETVIDHLAKKVFTPKPQAEGEVQSATTPSGKPVEEQVRKKWDPKKNGGLPIFTRRG